MQVWIEMFKCLSVHSALCHISKVIMKVHKVLKWVKNNSKVQQIAFNINVKTIIHIHLIAVYVQLSVQEHCIQFALKHIPLYYCISIISTIFRRMLKSMLFFHKDKLQKWLKSTIKVQLQKTLNIALKLWTDFIIIQWCILSFLEAKSLCHHWKKLGHSAKCLRISLQSEGLSLV